MPMAGEGRRFLKEGWNTPKPLIEIDGKPLFIKAIESVAMNDVIMKFSFIVRQDHIVRFSIDKCIKERIPTASIFSVEKTTRGAVETCLIAESHIEDDDVVIVMDCDLEFKSKQFKQCIAHLIKDDNASGGVVVSFDSQDPRYSYAEIDIDGNVIRTAEKKVISNHALCGSYLFASGREFKEIAHRLLESHDAAESEYYVSLLYNYLIENGDRVQLVTMEDYRSYGTPEELSVYL